MKKLLLFSLLLWQFNCLKAQSWIYHPLPNDSVIWEQNFSYATSSSFYGEKNWYKLLGDTLINSISYHKLYEHQIIATNPSQLTPPYFFNNFNYIGAIRQDVIQKVIYYKPKVNTEIVLFDFKLIVGDTIKNVYDKLGNDMLVGATGIEVQKVDSILIGGQYHKLFKLDTTANGFGYTYGNLVEGVGNLAGLFQYKSAWLNNGYQEDKSLQCFSVKNISLYGTGQCGLNTSINENNIFENNITVFPNPTNGRIQIKTTETNACYFEITNILGESILKSQIVNDKTEIDLSKETNGIYFIRVVDLEGNSAIKKIIKQ